MAEEVHLHRSAEMENLSNLSNDEINKPFSEVNNGQSRRALIVVDLQNDYFPNGKWPLDRIEQVSDNAQRLLTHCRSSGDLIIFIRHEFINADAPFFQAASIGAQIHSKFLVDEKDFVVTKNHVNAFRETNLKHILDSHSVGQLIICGAMTHMCIDAITRSAHDYSYQVSVIHDACASRDLSFNDQLVPAHLVQAAFMASISFAYAKTLSTDQFISQNPI